MARELKTVHIDNEATFVKMLLHQCYINERNIYSQVGVMAINLLGEPLAMLHDELPNQSTGELLGGGGGVPALRSNPKPSPGGGNDDLSFDLRFDAKTAARIREIQIAKDQAVTMEDYDQAKRLKQMEEQLKSIGLQLARLETQKRDAVANEDYDSAKRIKDEINMLEASVSSNESQPILAPVGNAHQSSASPTFSGNGNSAQGSQAMARSQVLPRAGAAAILGTKNVTSSSSFSPRDMYPEDQQHGSKRGNSGGFPGDRSPNRRPTSSSSSRHAQQDDDEDPATGGGAGSNGEGPNPNFRGLPDCENLPNPDEIPAALAKENEQLIDVIGLFFTRCFYSNLWNHRDAAIRKVTMDLERYPVDPIQLLEVCSTLVQSGAGDRIAQVALSAFRLVERMLPFSSKVRRDNMCQIVSLPECRSCLLMRVCTGGLTNLLRGCLQLGNSMTQIVNKLGEPQSKVRDEAAAILMRLASAKNVGVEFVASHITKRSKKPLGLKFLQGRLLVMKDLVAKFDLIPDSDHSVGGIMSFLEDSNCFAHQNREIRDPAKELTVALYEVRAIKLGCRGQRRN